MFDFLTLALVVTLFGSSTFFRKLAVDGMNPYHLQALAAAVYLSLAPIWLKLGPQWVWPTGHTLIFALGAILTNVIGAVIFGFLLKASSSPTMLAVAASTSPVITALLAYVFINESFTVKKIMGIVFVIIGMILFNT